MKQAAGLAASNGIDVIVTNGKKPDSLYEAIKGNPTGTLFVGKVSQ